MSVARAKRGNVAMMRNALLPCPQLFSKFHTFSKKGVLWMTFSSLSNAEDPSFSNSSMSSSSSSPFIFMVILSFLKELFVSSFSKSRFRSFIV